MSTNGPKSADQAMMEREGAPIEMHDADASAGAMTVYEGDQEQQRPRAGPKGDQQMTVQEQRKKRAEQFYKLLDARVDNFRALLEVSNVPVDRFKLVARQAVIQTKDLLDKGTPESFLIACLRSATDGLIPDGREAAFTVYGNVVQYMPMYQGMLKVAYRCGALKRANCQVIYEGEDRPEILEYDLGSDAYIKFRPPLAGRDDRKKIIGAFATGEDANGKVWVELMGEAELLKVKAISKAKNGPNKDWPGEMARKAPLRRMLKFVPKHPQLDQLLEHDDDNYLTKPDPAAGHLPATAVQIPDNALFDGEVYVAPAEPEHDDDGVLLEGVSAEVAEEVLEEPPPEAAEIFASLVRVVEGTTTLEEVDTWEADIRASPNWNEIGEKYRRLLAGKLEIQRAKFTKPTLLKAKITSTKPAKDYEDPRLWEADLLGKISAAKPPILKAFAAANLPFIREAQALGGQATKSADRVLAALLAKGISTEEQA